MVFNPDITAVDPSQFFERLAEGRVASARLRNVGEVVRLKDEPGQAARLQRARRERPRRCSAGNPFDEIASSHAASRELTLPIGGNTSLLDDRRPSVDLRLE